MNINNINLNSAQNISIGFKPELPSQAPAENTAPQSTTPQDSFRINDDSGKEAKLSRAAGDADKKGGVKCADFEGKVPDIMVMRENGLENLVGLINDAQESIDVHIYIMTANTPELMDAFKDALNRGVKVRLMVEDDPFYWTRKGENPSEEAINELVAAGAEYKPDHPDFSKSRVTHEKSIVFDDKKALILTGNLGSSTFGKNLDLGAILIENPKIVNEVKTIFDSDWDRTPLPDMPDTSLVISPNNAREKLEGLIGSAQKSIQILQQGFSDKGIINLVASKIDEGIDTELTLTDPGIAQGNMQNAAYLALKGAKVNFLVAPYIHAKAINIDARDDDPTDDKTYVGSQNFSMSAIDRNRELGIIFNDPSCQLNGIIDKYKQVGFEIPSKMVVSDNQALGSALKSAIRTAEDKIIIQTNLFSDKTVRTALKTAAKNGVDVQVMMPQNPFPWDPNCTFNIDSAKDLETAGVKVQWSDSAYKSMQGTCAVIDGKESILFPDNISGTAFRDSNTLGVINIGEKEVKETLQLLEHDWSKAGGATDLAALSPTSGIVSSPGNARQQIQNLIRGAESSINIAAKSVNDEEMIAALADQAAKGVKVRVMVPEKRYNKKDEAALRSLAAKGVEVRRLESGKLNNNYIETDNEKAYVGGHSLSAASLDNARGFGNIVTHEEMIRIARGSFTQSWLKAGVDAAKNTLSVEKYSIGGRDDLAMELIQSSAQRGIRVTVNTANFDDSKLKADFEILNRELREIAALDPSKDMETIADYFGMRFEQDKAKETFQGLQEGLAKLKPGEELLSGSTKAKITQSVIKVDGKAIEVLPERSEELVELSKQFEQILNG